MDFLDKKPFCILYIDPGEVLALPANTFNASEKDTNT
jgi:hypothetical protein